MENFYQILRFTSQQNYPNSTAHRGNWAIPAGIVTLCWVMLATNKENYLSFFVLEVQFVKLCCIYLQLCHIAIAQCYLPPDTGERICPVLQPDCDWNSTHHLPTLLTMKPNGSMLLMELLYNLQNSKSTNHHKKLPPPAPGVSTDCCSITTAQLCLILLIFTITVWYL